MTTHLPAAHSSPRRWPRRRPGGPTRGGYSSALDGHGAGTSALVATSFAELLRQHRLAARLTQEALAERAGLSVNGIQKLESGSTRPYRETVRRLVEALRVTPEELVAFQAAAQPQPRQRAGAAPGR